MNWTPWKKMEPEEPTEHFPEYDGFVYLVITPEMQRAPGSRMELNGWSRNQRVMSGLVLSLKVGEEVTFRRLR